MHRGLFIHKLVELIMCGKRSHDQLEQYIDGYHELESYLSGFPELLKTNRGGVEHYLAVDHNWKPYFGPNVYYKGVLDLWIDNYYDEGHALVVEFKTGMGRGHEDNKEQVRLYSALLFAHFESIKFISPKIIYLDMGWFYPDTFVLTRNNLEEDKISWSLRR